MIQGIGIAAGFFTAISLVPQVIKIIKEKKAQDISLFYLAILFIGLCLWISYGFLKKDVPVLATNILSLLINCLTFFLSIKFKKN